MKKIFLFALLFLLAACAPARPPTATPLPAPEVQVVIVPSELFVGLNRFAVGLIDPARGMIHDATVHFQYFDISDPAHARLESEADATRIQTPDQLTTIYAHTRAFDRAGNWGVEVQARFPNGSEAVERVAFQVVKDSPTKKPGEPAPIIKTLTAADVANDFKKLTSATTPTAAFYQTSLDQAVKNGKPTVLLFSTPAFCQTRLCGPAYEIVTAIYARVGDAANFVHVEVFSGLPNPAGNNFALAPAMHVFGLTTEPWVFVIDRAGKIAYRVEGVFTAEEVTRELQAVLK